MNDDLEEQDFGGKERRQYVRIPFQRTINYRLCYEKFASNMIDANASNISQNGISFKTKYPPPPQAIISLDVSLPKLKEYLLQEKLTDVIDPEQLFAKGTSIFGEVVRVIPDPKSGFSSVAVKLILKKDPNAQKKIEEAKTKNHPQFIDPSIVPDEEKYAPPETPGKSHPQYIDPSLADEED